MSSLESPTPVSPGRLVARFSLAGAAGGALCALGDFGASWLWLTWWQDRVGLLWRLLALLLPAGALLGALLGLAVAGARGPLARLARRLSGGDAAREERARARLFPLPVLLVLAPGLATVGHLLFSGGKMSRLPGRPALEIAATAALLGGAYVATRLTARLWRSATGPARSRLVGGALLGLHVALTKADQLVLPKLYDYLHGLLTVAALATAALGVAFVARTFGRARSAESFRPTAGLALVPLAAVVLALCLTTLDRDQNVRVALFDARASNSRSVLQGLGPVLAAAASPRASADAIARARARRGSRATASADGLPVAPEAHVLLVTVDALRADHLGLYGYERGISQHLDRFAEGAVVFERAYAQAPHSSYSLCSLMVSEYLHETVGLGQPLPEATLPGVLGEGGYHTAAFFTLGIFHTEGERLSTYHDSAFGFARHEHANMDAEERTDLVLEEATRIVEQGEPPSFLWVHYFDVHEPYEETALGTTEMDRYDGEIRNVDRAFDRLLRGIEERFDRDVVVVVSADHGEEFRDHGGLYHGSSLYEEQVRVPLLVSAPGLSPRRVARPVELVDVAPTLLGLLDVPTPSTMRGDDLRPLLAGREQDPGPVFSAVSHNRMALDYPYKVIADLRFNLFELYDLSTDPSERVNLANERPDELEEMKGEVYAFLDSLQEAGADPRHIALDRGRMGDRRAVPDLGALLNDATADVESRREAGRILARLADPSSAAALLAGIDSPEPLVAAEAAIALGRQYDDRARDALRRLVHSEDTDIRVRAAVSLGRLRDTEAVPALVDALYVSREKYEREEAVRWLGRLRDPRAVEPLIQLIPEFRLRYLTTVALGHIGDPRAFGPLAEVLTWEHRGNIRDSVARGLGQLGDRRAIPLLVPIAATEPELDQVFESLVRLGAIEAGAIGGADLAEATHGRRGFGPCEEGPTHHDWDYQNRTSCVTRASRASVTLKVPAVVQQAEHGVVVVRLRRSGDGPPVDVRVTVGGHVVGTFAADARWATHRFALPELSGDEVEGVFEVQGEDVPLAVDHLLLLPSVVPFDPS